MRYAFPFAGEHNHRHLTNDVRLDPVEDLGQALTGRGDAVVPQPDHGVVGIRLLRKQRGDARRQLLGPARVVHVGRGDALHPRVHVEDRADARMLLVDRPVLDRVDRDPARLDHRRDAEDDPIVVAVVIGDEQDVAPDHLEPALVDAARAHPESPLVLPRGEVAVGEAADAVEPLHVAKVALVEQLLDRERRGEKIEIAQARARALHLLGDLVAVPELGLEVWVELVVDDESRARQRYEAVGHAARELARVLRLDAVVPALHRDEPDPLAGHVAEDDVRKRADEQRVVRLEDVLGDGLALVDRGDERPARAAPKRLRVLGVDDVDDEIGARIRPRPIEPVLLERVAERADQPRERRRGRLTRDRELHGRAILRAPRLARCRLLGRPRASPDRNDDTFRGAAGVRC